MDKLGFFIIKKMTKWIVLLILTIAFCIQEDEDEIIDFTKTYNDGEAWDAYSGVDSADIQILSIIENEVSSFYTNRMSYRNKRE